MKVLIIEDDAEIRMAYSFALERNGITVLQAGDAQSGMRLLEQHQPPIVLLDMLMPGMSGLDFLRNNRIHQRFPDIQVLAFSNIETPRVVEQAKVLGVSQYLMKVNITPHQMVSIIQELAGASARTSQNSSQA